MLSKSTYGLVAALGIGGALALGNACSKTPPEPTADKPATTTAPPVVSGTSTITGSAPSAAASASGSTASTASGVSGSPGAAPPAGAGPEERAWEAPSAWQSVPNPNPMRKATYKIPKAGGDADDAELTVSAASGGVDQNIKRWEGQFGQSKAKTEPRNPNGLKVTLVEIKGTFAGGGMMGSPSAPKKDQMLLGAIVDAGEKQHFFKMVGGEKTVTGAKKDFDKFVASLRAK